jgi:hypothetical protein
MLKRPIDTSDQKTEGAGEPTGAPIGLSLSTNMMPEIEIKD